jgi:hypothetical protein
VTLLFNGQFHFRYVADMRVKMPPGGTGRHSIKLTIALRLSAGR